jgi:hypothetical protein
MEVLSCMTHKQKVLRNHFLMHHYKYFHVRMVGKPKGKKPLGKPRHRWVDNIKMDLRGTGWDGMD